MSHNSANHEAWTTRLRRTASRLYKKLRGQKLTLDDISIIRCPSTHNIVFEACRDGGATWNVYRFYRVSYGQKKSRVVHEMLYVSLNIHEVLDTFYHLHPDILHKRAPGASHPLAVARLVGHVFGSTD